MTVHQTGFRHEGLGRAQDTAERCDPKAKLVLAPGGVTAVEKEQGCPAEGMDQVPLVSSLLQSRGLGSLPSSSELESVNHKSLESPTPRSFTAELWMAPVISEGVGVMTSLSGPISCYLHNDSADLNSPQSFGSLHHPFLPALLCHNLLLSSTPRALSSPVVTFCSPWCPQARCQGVP